MKTFNIRSTAMALAIAATSSLAMLPATSHAFDEQSYAPINVDKRGIGVQGHDPVAYFTVGKPTQGTAEFQAAHEGVVYRFASAANRDLFLTNPKFDGDPKAWHIADGKLYLNLNPDVQAAWLKDVPGHNKSADAQWPGIALKTPKSL
jgi:YHS domain-containing protein